MSKHKFLLFLFLWGLHFTSKAENSTNRTPYDALYTHLHYLGDKENYNPGKSARAFDVNNQREAERLAVQLRQILDGRGIYVKLSAVPDVEDYVDTIRKKQVYILSERLPVIYLEKKGKKWYYSNETVEAIPKLHKLVYPFGSNVWLNIIPYKTDYKFLTLSLWQWMGMGIMILLFIAVFWASKWVSYYVVKKIVEKKISKPFDDHYLLTKVANYFSLLLALIVFRTLLPTLLLSPLLSASVNKAVDIISAIVFIGYLYNVAEIFMRYAAVLAKRTSSKLDDQLVLVLRRFIKAGIVIMGIFLLLKIFGVNVTTVIAGISIGGLAIALAAQDTVKNFIGSLMIFADRPFRIGDTIVGADFEGVVEEVGFRSSRIRTANNSVVAVANGKLADMTIDNKGHLVYKRYKTDVAIPYDTPPEVLQQFMDGVKRILTEYPSTKSRNTEVFVAEMQPNGIIVTIAFMYKPAHLKEELKNREFILLQILRLANLLQITFYDQQTLLRDNTPQPEKRVVSSDEVASFFDEFEQKIQEKKK